MKMTAAFIEAFGVGIGIGVAIAVDSRLFRITIANPDTDSDSECYGLSLFSEQVLCRPKDRLIYEYGFGDNWNHSEIGDAFLFLSHECI
jgi:hypothetical protein